MSDGVKSCELQPGDRLRFRDDEIVVLDRRKSPADDHRGLPYHPGWWLRDGGGLADYVIDDPDSDWTVYPTAAFGEGRDE